MADIFLRCESCHGKRFKQEVLEIEFNGKNISEILDLTVEGALAFFKDKKNVYDKILPLHEVGLGYVKLGQSSNSLSGGEAQRVKLASFLGKNSPDGNILFIFDEPTRGVDVGAKTEIYQLMNRLTATGVAIIMISSELLEVLGMSDRILVMRGGRVAGEFSAEEATQERILHCALGEEEE